MDYTRINYEDKVNDPRYIESYVYLCCKTNSTMFTSCCNCAICDNERCCPKCGSLVYGHSANSESERRIIRWNYAFGK